MNELDEFPVQEYEGGTKTVKKIEVTGNLQMIIYFTDGTKLELEAFADRIHGEPRLLWDKLK
jgi:hypothetical protein